MVGGDYPRVYYHCWFCADVSHVQSVQVVAKATLQAKFAAATKTQVYRT